MGLTKENILANLKSESIGIGSRPITPGPENLEEPIRSLYCEGAGDVTFEGLDGKEDTWAVPDNYTIPIAMQKVLAATATGLHGVV